MLYCIIWTKYTIVRSMLTITLYMPVGFVCNCAVFSEQPYQKTIISCGKLVFDIDI